MTVWVVWWNDPQFGEVRAVFDSREKAEAFVGNSNKFSIAEKKVN